MKFLPRHDCFIDKMEQLERALERTNKHLAETELLNDFSMASRE